MTVNFKCIAVTVETRLRMTHIEDVVFSYTKHPTYRIIFPESVRSDDTITGWWIFHPPKGCVTTPRPGQLSTCGWISVMGLVLLFWPLSCVPCFFSGCYEGYQIPEFSADKKDNAVREENQNFQSARV